MPADGRFGLRRILIPGSEDDVRRQLAMRKRDTSIGRHRDGRGHAGDDLKVDARRTRRFRFFSTTTEDEWIPALQADDDLALACVLDQHSVDDLLLDAP